MSKRGHDVSCPYADWRSKLRSYKAMMEKENAGKRRPFRSGFVAILGRPNAGKSTLINRLVGQKIAIVTSKPQTTRNRIQGIVTKPEGQIVFIDTPGLHEADSALGRQMMQEVAAALEGIDVLLLIVDTTCVEPARAEIGRAHV